MQVVILCGGKGTRLAEETSVRPKPMVTVGGRPILWHIMKIYSQYGFNQFALALGYKSDYIKNYFLNYRTNSSDVSINLKSGKIDYMNNSSEDWVVNLKDTGDDSMTGGRLKRMESWLRPQGTFMLTYGDGVANINVNELLAFHCKHGKLATLTAARPAARFGALQFEGDQVTAFQEKPQLGEGWVNSGFFIFEPEVFDYLIDDDTILERDPLERLAQEGQLMAYKHHGFWHMMDTIRDRDNLESIYAKDKSAWALWEVEKEGCFV